MTTRIYLLTQGNFAPGGEEKFATFMDKLDPLRATHGVGMWATGKCIDPMPVSHQWSFNMINTFTDVGTADEFFAEPSYPEIIKTYRDPCFKELQTSLFKADVMGCAPRPKWSVTIELFDGKAPKEPTHRFRKTLAMGKGIKKKYVSHHYPSLVLAVFDDVDTAIRYFDNRKHEPRNLSIFKAEYPDW